MQVCSILMMLLNNPMSDSVVEYVAVGELLRAAFYHITLPPTITPFRRIFSNGALTRPVLGTRWLHYRLDWLRQRRGLQS